MTLCLKAASATLRQAHNSDKLSGSMVVQR